MAQIDMKSLSDEQLVSRIREAERELVQTRFRHSMQQLENTATLGAVRKEIARMKTEVRSRELANGLPKGALVAQHKGAAPAVAEGEAPAERGGFLKGIVDRLTGSE